MNDDDFEFERYVKGVPSFNPTPFLMIAIVFAWILLTHFDNKENNKPEEESRNEITQECSNSSTNVRNH